MNRKSSVEYYHMNSYLRMLIHKVGQYYNMGHFADTKKRAIVLYRLPDSKMLVFLFIQNLEKKNSKLFFLLYETYV